MFASLFAFLAKYIGRMLFATLKVNFKGKEEFMKLAEKHRCLLVLWHENVAMTPAVLAQLGSEIRFSAMVSKSRDAEPLAKLIESYPNGTSIRVPHDARGDAFQSVIKMLKYKKDVIILTPDGPKGPPKVVKKGAVHAAMQTGAFVVPFSWKASRLYRFKTWDKMKLPMPFSKLDIIFGPPISSIEGEAEADFSNRIKESLESIS